MSAGVTVRCLPAAGLLLASLWAAASCAPDPATPEGLYHRQCARCHGSDGAGNRRAAKTMPDLDLTGSLMVGAGERAEIRQRIVFGEGSMPPFGDKLSDEEIEVLVAYTLELAGGEAPR